MLITLSAWITSSHYLICLDADDTSSADYIEIRPVTSMICFVTPLTCLRFSKLANRLLTSYFSTRDPLPLSTSNDFIVTTFTTTSHWSSASKFSSVKRYSSGTLMKLMAVTNLSHNYGGQLFQLSSIDRHFLTYQGVLLK